MKNIGTHDGKFHADEAFACAMLQMMPTYAESKITRTRDEAILKTMDVVVDVGGVYDASTNRFDHHQPTFHDTFSSEHKTLLSSAGLIYKHFAKEIIAAQIGEKYPKESVELLYKKIYDYFVEPFDAHDNGISAYPSDIRPLFQRSWDIFAQVNILNPDWNEVADVDSRFEQAVQLVRCNFEAVLRRFVGSWLPGRAIVERCLVTVPEVPVDSRVLVLDSYCPWVDHLFELEAALGVPSPILYAVYEDSTKRSWRIQAVPKTPDSFECRLALPSAWRGLREKELDSTSGIEGCVFVHRAGFIGGHSAKDGAIQMAIESLKQLDDD